MAAPTIPRRPCPCWPIRREFKEATWPRAQPSQYVSFPCWSSLLISCCAWPIARRWCDEEAAGHYAPLHPAAGGGGGIAGTDPADARGRVYGHKPPGGGDRVHDHGDWPLDAPQQRPHLSGIPAHSGHPEWFGGIGRVCAAPLELPAIPLVDRPGCYFRRAGVVFAETGSAPGIWRLQRVAQDRPDAGADHLYCAAGIPVLLDGCCQLQTEP